jgi:Concanavalin A-like lectin/glucanases superfamily
MKKIIFTSVMLVLLIGCGKNSILPTQPQISSLGKVSLNIDKTSAPSNVVNIKAILSRDGYDTLSSTYNVTADSSANLTINNIPAGDWLLTIDAFDGNGAIVYSGDANITIMAGITEQVALTLSPTGQGTGNISIQVTWGQKNVQSVLQLDGTSGYIEVPDSPSLMGIDTAITMEAWIKPIDERYYDPIVVKGVTSYGIECAQGLYPGIYLKGVSVPDADNYWGRIMVPQELQVNKWVHIAATYSPSSGVKVYYNDQLVYQVAATGTLIVDNNSVLRIGTIVETGYDEYFGGSIDDVRIWNVVRTQEQIAQNMNKELTGNETGLVADWKFDQAPTSNNVVYDSSPNHNDGVLHGGASIVTESAY